ncbi:MAG: hypothetical protein KKA84_08635 [Bacteroidetes bacterium]|nr:hypothetical protein [Bacteroidota bacterium]
MEKYYKAVENKICKMCIDADNEGDCVLTEEEHCAVKMYLPQIVEIVHKTNNDNLDEHLKKLRAEVCADCNARDAKGKCHLREDSNCALDRYFTVIVETIKKVDSGKI